MQKACRAMAQMLVAEDSAQSTIRIGTRGPWHSWPLRYLGAIYRLLGGIENKYLPGSC